MQSTRFQTRRFAGFGTAPKSKAVSTYQRVFFDRAPVLDLGFPLASGRKCIKLGKQGQEHLPSSPPRPPFPQPSRLRRWIGLGSTRWDSTAPSTACSAPPCAFRPCRPTALHGATKEKLRRPPLVDKLRIVIYTKRSYKEPGNEFRLPTLYRVHRG